MGVGQQAEHLPGCDDLLVHHRHHSSGRGEGEPSGLPETLPIPTGIGNFYDCKTYSCNF